jgi:hypothetical protein
MSFIISITFIIAVVSVVSGALDLSLEMCTNQDIKMEIVCSNRTLGANYKNYMPGQFVWRNAILININLDELAHTISRNTYTITVGVLWLVSPHFFQEIRKLVKRVIEFLQNLIIEPTLIGGSIPSLLTNK